MPIYDINGNVISSDGGNQDFFDITYPAYSNIYDPETDGYTDNTKLGGSGGTLITLNGSTTSEYVNISEYVGKYVIPQYGTVKTINPFTEYNTYPYYTYLEFYDSSKAKIGSTIVATSGDYETARNPVLIPQGAAFMRCSWNISYGGVRTCEMWQLGVFIVDTANGTIPFEPFYSSGEPKTAYIKTENLGFTDRPLYYGKKWVLFGDSLTDAYGGHDWQESKAPASVGGWKGYYFASKIARELGLIIDNRAKSGSNINASTGGQYSDVSGVNMLDAFLQEIENGTATIPQYITVAFGSNAFISQIGSISDTSATNTTVYGATKYFIERIREVCPMTALGFVLPPQSDWGESNVSKSVSQGREAIKAVLDTDEYSVPYCDMWKESGITIDMLPDGIHINSEQANNLYYHAMRKFMLGL